MPETEVKIYKISGKYVMKHQKFSFTKHVRALSEDNAMEKVLSTVTASKILRRKITITECKVISAEECDDLYIKTLATM
ncbi:50S ribosomal protein L18Ae [Candidatus Lokiarchaeum ossiferum]|uniref:50S ribosomal protein L18Ae n=1 Tax=Candidatus Lokiarchaeum ossiferum TaxID=2951803 RepID=A0ABY6HQP1_9ARCH|nr:50S ribosomal protein L18Ae [Candidatus Lokiarchaeum sp. B-35]